MAVMTPYSAQGRAILWAQWRALRNYYFRQKAGVFGVLTAISVLVWYGFWMFGAFTLAAVTADPETMKEFAPWLPAVLLLMFAFFQLVPLIMVSTGLSLDLSRLIVYPVPHGQLFAIEAMLRVTTAFEMLIASAGLAAGLARNPQLPWWAPLPLVPFVIFNLLLSTGLRDLFSRLIARRYAREALVLVVVLLTALPQALMLTGVGDNIAGLARDGFGPWWPWAAAAALLQGSGDLVALAALLAWTIAGGLFGRWQFERSLRFDAAASRSAPAPSQDARRATGLLTVPSRLFRDPIAALVEKELRVLARAPRFRLLFVMGFTFGLMIWLPMALSAREPGNFLPMVSAYALLLLGEICFWNIFGMDRAAAQTWFVSPVPFASVLISKNVAAACFIFLEVAMVCLACLLLRLPVTAESIGEAFGAVAVLALFLFSIGNILSVRYPRPTDPAQSWKRGAGGKVQAMLFLIYPLAGAPVLLAYAARYAFEADLAFYGVLLLDLIIGAILYGIALESAASTAQHHREEFIGALSRSEGPLA